MNWERTMTNGVRVTQQGGSLPDLFRLLAEGAAEEGFLAKVSSTVSHGTEYGEIKCSCTITISCPQDAAAIERASAVAFKTAVGFVNDGLSHIAPELEPFRMPL